jgi:hypothetical protein
MDVNRIDQIGQFTAGSLYRVDWIPAHDRAGSDEGGCVGTPVLGVHTEASEMTYVVSVYIGHDLPRTRNQTVAHIKSTHTMVQNKMMRTTNHTVCDVLFVSFCFPERCIVGALVPKHT